MKKIFTAYLLISLFGFINATNYYVYKNATGSNNGTNWSNAWTGFSSINWSVIKPGDIIYVSGGVDSTVYNQGLTIGKSGSVGFYITVRNSYDIGHNGRIIIRTGKTSGQRGILISNKSYVYVKGFEINGTSTSLAGSIEADNSSNFVIDSLKLISDTYQGGVYVENNNNFTIKNCVISTPNNSSIGEADGIYSQVNRNGFFLNNHITISNIVYDPNNDRTHADGIQSYQDNGMTFANNEIYITSTNANNGNSCIYATAMTGGTFKFYNNLIFLGNARYATGIGVDRYGGAIDSLIIYNNTVVATGSESYNLISLAGFSNPFIKNNIAYSPNSMWASNFSDITNYSNIDYNCWFTNSTTVFNINGNNRTFIQWKNLGAELHGINANPQLQNNTRYKLQSNSPCIDAGTTLSNLYDIDKDGVIRTNIWDMGAYEYSDGSIFIDTTPPNLLSALVINPTTIELTFSEALKSSSALTKTNYLIDNGIIVNSVSISSDSKKVTLNTTQNTANQIYTVVVSNVIDLASNIISSSNNSAQYSYVGDTTPPNLLSALVINSTTIELTFSEALESSSALTKTNYLIDNGIIINSVTLSSDGKKVTLNTTQNIANKIYTLFVSNVKDLSGNIISTDHNSVNYNYIENNPVDLVKYQLIQAVAQDWYLNYTPDKSIDGQGSSVPSSRWGGASPMPDTISYDLGSSKLISQTKISFYNWDTGRKYKFTILISEDGINWQTAVPEIWSDALEWNVENFIPVKARFFKLISLENNQSVYAGVWEFEVWGNNQILDTISPRLLGAKLTDSTTIELTFSEKLENRSSQVVANYSITNNITVLDAKLSVSQNIVILKTSTHSSGNYSIIVQNVTDLAGNLISQTNNSADYMCTLDNTPPNVSNLSVTNTKSITLNFSERIDPVKAMNKNNYSVTNNVIVSSAQLLPDSMSVLLKTSTQVRNKDYMLTISNISDESGNNISPNPTAVYYRLPKKGIGYAIQSPIQSAFSNNWNQSYLPEKTIDGQGMNNPDSRWMSNEVMPDTINFDLGNINPIDSLRISFYKWESNCKYKYSVYSSIDSLNWKPILNDIWSDSSEWTEIEFDSTQAKFIKLILLESNLSPWASIWEIEIFGPSKIANTNNEEEFPALFSLAQNYPNPFNPSTKISWQSPMGSWQTLKVYDILGNEVATLINEYKPAGSYEVEFSANGGSASGGNAYNLTSGVYFYRFQAGSFVETKKMILLK